MSLGKIIHMISFVFIIQLMVLGQSGSRESNIIAIDLGHSSNRPGAISSRGKYEYDFNKIFASTLLTRLKKEGYKKSFLINPSSNDINERVDLATKNGADILISIHHDSVQPLYLKKWIWREDTFKFCDRYSGYSVFVSSKNKKFKNSVVLASKIGEELIKGLYTPSMHHSENIKGERKKLINTKLGIYIYDDLIILKNASIPAVLLECGIIVNRKDELQLSDEKNINEMANLVSNGITNFFKSEKQKQLN